MRIMDSIETHPGRPLEAQAFDDHRYVCCPPASSLHFVVAVPNIAAEKDL